MSLLMKFSGSFYKFIYFIEVELKKKFSIHKVFWLFILNIKNKLETSLVAQRLRICLPMQGTRVRALVGEDPTCRGATKPVRHNY